MRQLRAFSSWIDSFFPSVLKEKDVSQAFRSKFLILLAFSLAFSHVIWIALLDHSYEIFSILGGIGSLLAAILVYFAVHYQVSYRYLSKAYLGWIYIILGYVLWNDRTAILFIPLWIGSWVLVSFILCGLRYSLLSLILVPMLCIPSVFHFHLSLESIDNLPFISELLRKMRLQVFASCFVMFVFMGFFEYFRMKIEENIRNKKVRSMQNHQILAVGELVGNMAHEVNNPLNIINGTCFRLRKQLEKNKVPNDINSILSIMLRTYDRVIRVHGGLAVFASGNSQEPIKLTDVETIFKDVLIAMKVQARAKNIKFEMIDTTENHSIKCRVHQIFFVLCGLIQNAIDACQSGSNSKISIEAKSQLDSTLFQVRDTGVGIDANIHNRIFSPFFSTKSTGTIQGMSLSVCRRIIQEHGGNLVFKSQPGETIFEFDIPYNHKPDGKFIRSM